MLGGILLSLNWSSSSLLYLIAGAPVISALAAALMALLREAPETELESPVIAKK